MRAASDTTATTNNKAKSSININNDIRNKILLVDDESDILEVCKLALLADNSNNKQQAVDAFLNPEKALQQFTAHPYAYNLVLTDVRMPRLSGFELAREIRKVRLDIPILFMTAFEINDLEYKNTFPAA